MFKYQKLIKTGGIILINSSLVDGEPDRDDIFAVKIPANKIALELGNERAVNMIMLGAFSAKTGVTSLDSLIGGMSEVLKSKKAGLVELNKAGMEKGAEYALNA